MVDAWVGWGWTDRARAGDARAGARGRAKVFARVRD